MTELSVRHLQPFAQSAAPSRPTAIDRAAKRVRAATWQHDLMIVAAFCAIGLVLTFAVLAQVPDLSASIGQISLVP